MPSLSRRRPEEPPDVLSYLQFPHLRPVIPDRDWAELPLDAISYILRKLDLVELLQGGVAAVCSSWRLAARHEPELWRRIDISRRSRFTSAADLDDLARRTVCLSAGQCEDFCGQYLDDDFLRFLAHRAPLLRCLRLKFGYDITDEGFAAAITNFPLLEELELDLCHGIDDAGVFEHVARSCPRMKHITYLKYRPRFFHYDITDPDNDREALAIASMPELRTLQLYRDKLTNTGLASIIDNCPHLEFLDIRSCDNITIDDALRAKCSRIKKKTLLPYFEDRRDHFDDPFDTASAISSCPSLSYCDFYADKYISSCYNYLGEDDDSCYNYLGEDDEINLEHYDKMLDKSMWRYKM